MSEQVKRAVVAYKPTNQIFVQKEKNYIQQYSHVYLKRLLALRPVLLRHLREVEKCPVAEKVIGLRVGEHVAVVGTLYKDQKLKPNILDEFSAEVLESPLAIRENYASEDDGLLLEDESGRCTLMGDANWPQFVGEVVSGVVVACIGRLLEGGSFEVQKAVFPGQSINWELGEFKFKDDHDTTPGYPRYLLLTSNIYAGSTAENNSVLLQLLVDFVGGFLGDAQQAASIVRCIVAGGAISLPKTEDLFRNSTIDAKLQAESQTVLVENLRVADTWFAELASTCPVDIMPGEFDPCNISLPQQPLHPCLFPTSTRFSESFRSTTNPHSFKLGQNLQALGHSGQPLRDALRHQALGASPLAFLEDSLLKYMHLAPTAPDTLACYPFFDRDPFVTEKPSGYRLLFAGGCPAFATSFKQGVRIVCVPDFKQTRQVVLVNLDSPDLSAQVITFEVQV